MSEISNLKEWRVEQKADLRRVESRQREESLTLAERQYEIRQDVSVITGAVREIAKQVDHMDSQGNRVGK